MTYIVAFSSMTYHSNSNTDSSDVDSSSDEYNGRNRGNLTDYC